MEKIMDRAPPTPENHERMVGINRTDEWPQVDAAGLEAGANRCAAG